MRWPLRGKKKEKQLDKVAMTTTKQEVLAHCPNCNLPEEIIVDKMDAAHALKCDRCDSVYVLSVRFEVRTEKAVIKEPWKGLIGKIKDHHEGRIFFHFDVSRYIGTPEEE
jgi:uncharacterized C2H2 Zn-finger protein